jgi:integral membrane protein
VGPQQQGVEEPAVGEIISSSDPDAMLRRKVRVTRIIAAVEVVSYLCLLVPMYRKHILDDDSTRNYLYLRIIAYVHGIICAAFAVMVIDIHRALRWSKWFLLATLAGPIGAVIAHVRLRRDPLPTGVRKSDFFLFR